MTFGGNNKTGGEFSLSAAEWAKFKVRKPVTKKTGDANGDWEVTIKLTRKRRKPGSIYEVGQV